DCRRAIRSFTHTHRLTSLNTSLTRWSVRKSKHWWTGWASGSFATWTSNMHKLILILIGALIFEAVGVVLLSQGLRQIGNVEKITPAEIKRVIAQGITNRNVMLGVLFEAIFFGALLVLLARADVSLIWPLTSI